MLEETMKKDQEFPRQERFTRPGEDIATTTKPTGVPVPNPVQIWDADKGTFVKDFGRKG
jgi:hypothetical protein